MCRYTYWHISICRYIKGSCHTLLVPNSMGNRVPVRTTALVFRKSGRRRDMQWRLVSFVPDPFSTVKLVRSLNDEQYNKTAMNLNQSDKLQLKRHVLKPICYMGFYYIPAIWYSNDGRLFVFDIVQWLNTSTLRRNGMPPSSGWLNWFQWMLESPWR